MRIRWLLALVLAVGLLAGCGGGGDSEDADDSDVRTPVVEFVEAVGAGDSAAGCDFLTEGGERVLVKETNLVAEELGVDQADTCVQALDALYSKHPPEAFARLGGLAGAAEDAEVAVAEDNGTVTITDDDTLLPVPVERIEGQWKIADPATLLFGIGEGGSEATETEETEPMTATDVAPGDAAEQREQGAVAVKLCADATGQDPLAQGEPVPGFVACLKRVGAPQDVIDSWTGG